MRLLKSTIVRDIEPPRGAEELHIYSGRINSRALGRGRINLHYSVTRRVPLTRFLKACSILFAGWIMIVGSAAAPTTPTYAANATTDGERQQLETQLKDLEGQISQYEDQIAGYRKQGNTLKGEIGRLNGKIAKINLQIKAINLTLSQLDLKIKDAEVQISATEESISRNKAALGDLLKNVYQNDQTSLVEIFLKKPKLSDFFSDVNGLALIQRSVRNAITQISDLRDTLHEEKDQFALARADAATLREYQLTQKSETDQAKAQKNNLLAITKGEESKYQAVLKQTKETAAQIRNRIFQLLGGGQLTFEQAYEYAKVASAATGVRPAFILAVLDRESALGQNVGKCGYKTAMNPKDQPVFLALTASLGINPESITVSCPNADGVYGGAMGPAQFIPGTWNLYADLISQITGHSPASPWNNADAFVAAALYLRDVGAAQSERVAAAKYYCGSRWNRYVCTSVYGARVIEQAAQFQNDIDAIIG